MVNKRHLYLSLFILCGLMMKTVYAQQPVTPALLQSLLEKTQQFESNFEQITLDKVGQQVDHSFGQVSIQRPGRFRWDYKEPYAQMVLADSKKLWVYDQDLEQVTVKPQDEALQSVPASLLSGKIDDLMTQFEITQNESEAGAQLLLVPTQTESNLGQLQLSLNSQGLPIKMVITDRFGQTTTFMFTQARIVDSFPNDRFKFVPPEGVDVLGASQ